MLNIHKHYKKKNTCCICENVVEDKLSDGAISLALSTWSRPDDEVSDTVRLRSGAGIPEVVSAEVEAVGIEKQVERRPSNRLATSCSYKDNNIDEKTMSKQFYCFILVGTCWDKEHAQLQLPYSYTDR